jgi:endonuclease/exonuclease/phosphatase family metal-dependent hydrolase
MISGDIPTPRQPRRLLWLSGIVLLAIVLTSPVTQAPTPEPRASAVQANDSRLTVMTLNLGDGLVAPNDLVSYIRQIGANLVALQEVTPEIAEALATDLVDILPYQVVRGLGIPGKALLSSYPITQAEWLELNPGRPDLLATVDVAGRPIDVLVAHPPPPELDDGIVQPREGTFEQFDRIVGIAAAAENPFLLMGDLNETALQSRHGELEALGLRDVFAEVGSGSGDTYPNRVPPLPDFLIRPVLRIDYIWASADWLLLAAAVGEDVGSDHLPVTAQLALAGAVAPATAVAAGSVATPVDSDPGPP